MATPDYTLMDPLLYSDLVKRYGSRIDALCYLWANDNAEADDMRDEALVLLWQRLAERKPDKEPPGWWWVFRVVRSAITDHWRRRRHMPTVSLDSIGDQPQPDDSFAAETLEEFTACLNKEDRRLIGLVLEGYSGDELAEQFGQSPATTRKRLSRAIAKMRKLKDKIYG